VKLRRGVLPAVVAVVATLAFHWGRDYPLPLAVMLALAVGALAWAVERTVEQLRASWRQRR
jgi:hypothetical protein